MGHPRGWDDLTQAAFVAFGETAEYIEGMRALNLPVTAQKVPVQVDNHLVHWEMVNQGASIGFKTVALGDAEPLECRLPPEAAPIIFPIWLVTHRELHTSRCAVVAALIQLPACLSHPPLRYAKGKACTLGSVEWHAAFTKGAASANHR